MKNIFKKFWQSLKDWFGDLRNFKKLSKTEKKKFLINFGVGFLKLATWLLLVAYFIFLGYGSYEISRYEGGWWITATVPMFAFLYLLLSLIFRRRFNILYFGWGVLFPIQLLFWGNILTFPNISLFTVTIVLALLFVILDQLFVKLRESKVWKKLIPAVYGSLIFPSGLFSLIFIYPWITYLFSKISLLVNSDKYVFYDYGFTYNDGFLTVFALITFVSLIGLFAHVSQFKKHLKNNKKSLLVSLCVWAVVALLSGVMSNVEFGFWGIQGAMKNIGSTEEYVQLREKKLKYLSKYTSEETLEFMENYSDSIFSYFSVPANEVSYSVLEIMIDTAYEDVDNIVDGDGYKSVYGETRELSEKFNTVYQYLFYPVLSNKDGGRLRYGELQRFYTSIYDEVSEIERRYSSRDLAEIDEGELTLVSVTDEVVDETTGYILNKATITVVNDGTRDYGYTAKFYLPPNALITNLTVNGDDNHMVVPRNAAFKVYEEEVNSNVPRDPAVLTQDSAHMYSLAVYPVPEQTRYIVSFEYMIPYLGDKTSGIDIYRFVGVNNFDKYDKGIFSLDTSRLFDSRANRNVFSNNLQNGGLMLTSDEIELSDKVAQKSIVLVDTSYSMREYANEITDTLDEFIDASNDIEVFAFDNKVYNVDDVDDFIDNLEFVGHSDRDISLQHFFSEYAPDEKYHLTFITDGSEDFLFDDSNFTTDELEISRNEISDKGYDYNGISDLQSMTHITLGEDIYRPSVAMKDLWLVTDTVRYTDKDVELAIDRQKAVETVQDIDAISIDGIECSGLSLEEKVLSGDNLGYMFTCDNWNENNVAKSAVKATLDADEFIVEASDGYFDAYTWYTGLSHNYASIFGWDEDQVSANLLGFGTESRSLASTYGVLAPLHSLLYVETDEQAERAKELSELDDAFEDEAVNWTNGDLGLASSNDNKSGSVNIILSDTGIQHMWVFPGLLLVIGFTSVYVDRQKKISI